MLPDLESVRCFVAGASHPTFRAAARACALSPPAFGERIRQLEAQAGGALFSRTTRRVALTPAGLRLLPEAKRLLEHAERALAAASEDAARAPFALTIGTRFELGLSWIVPALRRLADARPERTIHLTFGDSPELLAKLRAGQADAAITSARLTQSDVRYAILHEERYALVGRRALLRRHPLRRPADARAHTLLDLHADLPLFRYFLDAAPRGEVWGFGALRFLGTIAALRALVLEGAGLAVLPEYFVRDDLRRGRLVRLLPRVELRHDAFRLVWRAGHAREPELHALAGELRRLPLR